MSPVLFFEGHFVLMKRQALYSLAPIKGFSQVQNFIFPQSIKQTCQPKKLKKSKKRSLADISSNFCELSDKPWLNFETFRNSQSRGKLHFLMRRRNN